MKRRSFLGLLGGAVVAPAASLEAAPVLPTDPSHGFRHDEPIDAYFARRPRFVVVDEDGRRGYLQGSRA
jgi:hypothetical protein